MARTKRSAKLDTWNSRRKLKTGQMHQERLSHGQYIAYRRPLNGGDGTWFARWWNAEGKTIQLRLGAADDIHDANGETILTYSEAHAKALAWFVERERQAAMEADGEIISAGPFTVANALDAYFLDAERRGMKGLSRDKPRANAWIIPALGEIQVSKLTQTKIEVWLNEMANSPRRVRAKTGKKKAFAAPPVSEDEKRARKDTANRVLTILKAALTFCADRRLFEAISRPWELVKPYKGTASARIRFLAQEEQVRLVNVCPPDFKTLVKAGLLTGCRYGELTRLKGKDYNPENGSIFIAESKSGKPRHVVLTEEGVELFDELTAKLQNSDDLIFTHGIVDRKNQTRDTEGKFGKGNQQLKMVEWGHGHQQRLMAQACKDAGLEYISFHELRHTYASMLVNRGCILPVVAKQLGHSDTRMVEKHYAHLAPNTVRDEIIKAMPRLGIHSKSHVQKLKTAKS